MIKLNKGKVVVTQYIETPYFLEYEIVDSSLWTKAQKMANGGNGLIIHLGCDFNNADVSSLGLKLIEEQEDTKNREINHSRTECIEKIK